jgi:ferredoxin
MPGFLLAGCGCTFGSYASALTGSVIAGISVRDPGVDALDAGVMREELDVLIGTGLDAPYSCRQGICGACACQLTGGEVEMAHNEVLEAVDIADGYILACQSVPLTPDVSITY